jgi:hypothetical protein
VKEKEAGTVRRSPQFSCLSCSLPAWLRLNRAASGQKVDDQNHKRHEEQQVNKWPDTVAESKKPQDQKHYQNRPQHFRLLLFERRLI